MPGAADARRLLEFTARNQIPRSWVDVERDAGAEAMLRDFGLAPDQTPVVIWGERMLRSPDNAELARVLGFAPAPEPAQVVDLLVVVAGQAAVFLAGRTRRVYLLARRDLAATMSRYLTDQVARHPTSRSLPAPRSPRCTAAASCAA